MGDAEIGLLADTLSQMLDEWRDRLEQSKPSFPLGPARWGVLQMCMYDMWCTIEESRIWDVGLAETERFAHFFSPQLAAMLGRIRTRQSQAFDTTLSMSQRLQYELQRWNAQWNETAESFRREESSRQALQHHCHQLEAHVAQLEAENEIASALAASAASAAANGDDADPNAKRLERTLRRLQQQVVRLSQQLRQAHASNTSLRGRELSLKLSNDGMMLELEKWRAFDARGGSPRDGSGEGVDGEGGGAPPSPPTDGALASHPRLNGQVATDETAIATGGVAPAPAPPSGGVAAGGVDMLVLFRGSAAAPPSASTLAELRELAGGLRADEAEGLVEELRRVVELRSSAGSRDA